MQEFLGAAERRKKEGYCRKELTGLCCWVGHQPLLSFGFLHGRSPKHNCTRTATLNPRLRTWLHPCIPLLLWWSNVRRSNPPEGHAGAFSE